MKILVTGGAGYIGSHTTLALVCAGHEVVVLDNLVNGHVEALRRVELLAGKEIPFENIDIRDEEALLALFCKESFDVVLHFAGLKAVGVSREEPLSYYQTNVCGSASLINAMTCSGVKNLIFSSSATVYGSAATVPYSETQNVGCASSPYGSSKYFVEQILKDQARADASLSIIILRYFNPIGAHPSGMIGESPLGVAENLMPILLEVACGKREELLIFGDRYPTPDGTCRRDFVHVVDVAQGHVKALSKLGSRFEVFNLGLGKPLSVFELVHAFESETGIAIPYRVVDPRPGDLAEFWADPIKARVEMNWVAERGLSEMIRDAWWWKRKNPLGYQNP